MGVPLRFKKSLVVSAFCLVVTAKVASAFAPLVIPAWYWGASVVLHVAAAAGLYYAMAPGQSSAVSASGVKRPSNAVWVDLDTLNLNEKSLKAEMSLSKARQLASKTNPDSTKKYPLAYSAFNGEGYELANPTDSEPGNSVNKYAQVNGQWVKLTSYTGKYIGYIYNPPEKTEPFIVNGKVYFPVGQATPYYSQLAQNMAYYTYTPVSPPSPGPYSDSKSLENLTGSQSGGTLKSEYQSELDRMFQDPDYVPTFTDGTTGLPWAPPPASTVMSPDQLAAYNASGAARDAREAALDSARAATSNAAAALDVSRDAYVSSGGNPDTLQGGDASLRDAYVRARGAFDSAKAAEDRQAADNASADAEEAEEDSDNPFSLPSAGEAPDLDFSKFGSLKGALSSTYPFSLISRLPDLLSPFSRPPSAPVIHLPVYGNDMVVDLSAFDPVASVCRWCMGLFATVGVVYYVVHFWRGVS